MNALLATFSPKPTTSQGSNILGSLHRYSIPVDLVESGQSQQSSKHSGYCPKPVNVKATSHSQQTYEQAKMDVERNPGGTHGGTSKKSNDNKTCSCKKKSSNTGGTSSSKKKKKSTKTKTNSSNKSKKKSKPKAKPKAAGSPSRKIKKSKVIKVDTQLHSVL
jgi:hypothetical protein